MTKAPLPDVHSADPLPQAAHDAVQDLLKTADLFRYTAPENAPVSLLEAEFAQMIGAKYALAVSSCSAALFLSIKALELPRGARILIPAFTFAAVPSSIVHADCQPVLCECTDTYRIDLNDFAAKLPDCDAVLISHMRGHTSDMDAIIKACDHAGIPLIEDAAHSLGTTWHGRRIGTLGTVGCFSFQSYKMVNAGEGGIMITDDADLIARAIIMSGAYEHNWRKHPVLHSAFDKWQNKLPLYNLRLSNLAAAVIRPQLSELPSRIARGRRNHDRVAARLNQTAHIRVPAPLNGETRAPDSIQFNILDLPEPKIRDFADIATTNGVKVQVFGQSTDNARAFWNWEYLGPTPDLPQTRAMLMRACDVRLPTRLTPAECDAITDVLLDALAKVA